MTVSILCRCQTLTDPACLSGMLRPLQWPGCLDAVKPPNAGLKLFGGAAFERCLNEFQVAANMLAFPSCECCVVL